MSILRAPGLATGILALFRGRVLCAQAYFAKASNLKLFGRTLGEGRGLSVVGAGRGPNCAVTK